MKAIEHLLEVLIFNRRWLLAPFYLGLVVGIGMLLVKFGQELIHAVPNIFNASESEVVLAVLALVDLSLVANLLLIVIFSGYENFVSKINTKGHEDRPEWMGQVDFSSLKIKVIASIVAISAIELLKGFVNLSVLLKKRRRHARHLVRGRSGPCLESWYSCGSGYLRCALCIHGQHLRTDPCT